MAEETKLLQQYADERCGGDRLRAIYELMSSGEEGSFDPYVDELTQEEANFAVTLLHTDAIRIYGGKENFQKMVKAETLAASLETTADEVMKSQTNPYKKNLLFSVLKVLGSIAATVVLTLLAQTWSMEALVWIGPVLIGLAAMDTAESVRKVINFNRIKKLVNAVPVLSKEELENTEMATFEECMALYKELDGGEPVTAQEAAERLAVAKKKNIIALVLLPVYLIVMIIAGLFAMEWGIFGRILGCAIVLAYFLWQIIKTGKAVLATKAAGNVPQDDPQFHQLNKRQSLCVLAAILIWGVYLMMAVVGIMVCVTITA